MFECVFVLFLLLIVPDILSVTRLRFSVSYCPVIFVMVHTLRKH